MKRGTSTSRLHFGSVPFAEVFRFPRYFDVKRSHPGLSFIFTTISKIGISSSSPAADSSAESKGIKVMIWKTCQKLPNFNWVMKWMSIPEPYWKFWFSANWTEDFTHVFNALFHHSRNQGTACGKKLNSQIAYNKAAFTPKLFLLEPAQIVSNGFSWNYLELLCQFSFF